MWPALIAAGGALLGGIMGNNASARQASDAAQASELEGWRNREWQERMTSTAHQREVADLKAAGLNPILSGTGGMGSQSGSGGQGSGFAAAQHDVVSPAISSALSARRNTAEVENLEESNKQIREDTELKAAQRQYTNQLRNVADFQGNLYRQQVMTEEEETKRRRWEAEIAGHSAAGARIEGDIDRSGYGDFTRRMDRLAPLVGSAAHARRAFGAQR